MRRHALVFAFAGVALVPLACGGGAQQTNPQTPAPVAPSGPPAAIAGPASQTDLSVVPEPADVVAVVRWKSPAVTFSTIQQWFGIPVPVDDVADEIFRAPEAAAVLALDAPVDLVVALDPKATDRDPQPFVGFSVGMRSVDDARRVFEQRGAAQEVGPGIYRMELGRRHDRLTCLLGPSLGASPARLVCGPRDRDVEALQPYLARGLAAAAPPNSDIHGELRFGPVQRRYGAMLPSALQLGSSFLSHEIGTGDRGLDRALTDAVTGLSDEALALVNDLDGMAIDMAVDPGARIVSGELNLRFKSRSSWIAQRLFDNREKMGAPPELFWTLPAGSDAAFYNRGNEGTPYQGIRRVGGDLLRAGMANQNFPAADRDAVVKLFEQAFQQWPVSVSASGHLDAAPAGAARGDELERMRQQITASVGWQLIGVDEKSDRLDKWLRDLAGAYNRPAVQRWIATKSHLDAKKLPKVKYGAVTVRGLTGVKALEVAVSIDPPSYSYDGTPRDKKAKPVTFTYWVLLLPDGQRTWMALGADRPALEKRLAEARSGAARTGTLASRAGLEPLKSDRTLTGGFMSIAGVASQATGGLVAAMQGRSAHSSDFEEVLNALAKMPNHGETPMLVTTSVRDGTPSEVTMRFRANRGTIDDIASLTNALVGGRGGATMATPPPPPPPPPPSRRP